MIHSAETAVALVEGARAELSHLLGTTHPWATSSSSSSGFEQGRSSHRAQSAIFTSESGNRPVRFRKIIIPEWLEIHLDEWKIKPYLVTH